MANETPNPTPAPAAADGAAPPAGGAPPAAPAAGGGEPQWDPQTRTYIESIRQESAGYRTKARALEDQIKTLQPALKQWEDVKKLLSGEGAPPDPIAALKEKDNLIAQKDLTIREMKVMGDITDLITAHGLEPKGAKAILKSTISFADLDPSAPDYSKTLEGHVKRTAEDFAYLKVNGSGQNPKPPVPRSGSPTQTPGPGAGPDNQLTRDQLKGMKPEEVEKAFKEGRLNAVLGRK